MSLPLRVEIEECDTCKGGFKKFLKICVKYVIYIYFSRAFDHNHDVGKEKKFQRSNARRF